MGILPLVTLSNGASLTSTQRCKLPIQDMDETATSGYVISILNKSLLSIGNICDANYTAVFTNKDVQICKTPLKYRDKMCY